MAYYSLFHLSTKLKHAYQKQQPRNIGFLFSCLRLKTNITKRAILALGSVRFSGDAPFQRAGPTTSSRRGRRFKSVRRRKHLDPCGEFARRNAVHAHRLHVDVPCDRHQQQLAQGSEVVLHPRSRSPCSVRHAHIARPPARAGARGRLDRWLSPS